MDNTVLLLIFLPEHRYRSELKENKTSIVNSTQVYYHQSIQSYRPYEPVPIALPGEVAGPPGPTPPRSLGPGAHSWSYGARGWAAGAVILALLVLLVRAAENCLHKKLFRAIYAHTRE